MGAITLCQQISANHFDDWVVLNIKAYDKPAAQLDFIDVRHAYLLITLRNPRKVNKSCCQAFLDCWLSCCCFRCLNCMCGCLTCTCCCKCCLPSTEMQEALYSETITVLLQLTGSMTKGAFLRQVFYQFSDKFNQSAQQLLVRTLPNLSQCLDRDQLIMECSYKGNLRYGDLRKALVAKYVKTKYDIKTNNCFNFVITGFDALGMNSEFISKRKGIVEENVRKHKIVQPIQRMMS